MDNREKLRQRFAKDYNLPINIFTEDMFAYYAHLYDFFPFGLWYNLNEKIDNEYDGNIEKWLDYCAKVRDEAINTVTASKEWQEFNYFEDMHKYDIEIPIGEHSCYTEATVGKRFISIDLKKANFQALKYAGVLSDKTYEDFIERMGGDEYIKGSKYLRQVIFGKMNPSRQIKVEKYIMYNIYKFLKPLMDDLPLELFSMNSDELIYEVKGPSTITDGITKEIEYDIFTHFGINVRVEYIVIGRLPIINARGNKIDAYIRKNIITGEETLKKASTTFYPQIYKIWKGQEVTEKDRVFFFEDQLATFNEPLKLDIKIDGV